MTQVSHYWAYTLRNYNWKRHMYLNVHCSTSTQQPGHGCNPDAHWQMNKEVVVHIHNEILLSHENEHIWLSSNEVDKPRVYCTQWSKSERERQILYINTYIWNLERWYWWTYLQDSNGDTDIVDTGREGEGWTN